MVFTTHTLHKMFLVLSLFPKTPIKILIRIANKNVVQTQILSIQLKVDGLTGSASISIERGSCRTQ
uniref:Uncharacterized protein n=1 Tax=Octopus bimaculoides TaxID=37653 RepID=A0A0L8FUP6_OCTBM